MINNWRNHPTLAFAPDRTTKYRRERFGKLKAKKKRICSVNKIRAGKTANNDDDGEEKRNRLFILKLALIPAESNHGGLLFSITYTAVLSGPELAKWFFLVQRLLIGGRLKQSWTKVFFSK